VPTDPSPARPAAPAPARATPGLPWLVADIGGTNARFGWVADPARGVEHAAQLPVADFAGPAEAAAAYLDLARAHLGGAAPRPRRSAIALAAALAGDRVALTNAAWTFSRAALQAALGVRTLLLLNDFEALALSLPRLAPAQLRSAGELPRPHGALAVIGPGTGLGVGGVVRTPHAWVAVPGEGGHATLAAADDFESELLRLVRRSHAHVSAERVLSGVGLPLLHEAIGAVRGHATAPLPASEIVERAVGGGDAACRDTVEVFCALLGGFAGNVALTLGARGGLFVGGGIVPRLGELFFTSPFRARFEAKGRYRPYLEAIPTAVIVDTHAALTGAALALEQLEP
jgi:glucokinase